MCSITDLCFMCNNDTSCTFVDKRIVEQVEYLLPEITIIKLGIPLLICSICDKNLASFSSFKQSSVECSLRLEARMTREPAGKDVVAVEADSDLDQVTIDQGLDMPVEVNITEEQRDVESDQCTVNISMTESDTEEAAAPDPAVQNFLEIYIKEESHEEDSPNLQTKADSSEYLCQLCNKSYKMKSSLRNHMNLHNAANRFQCSVCSKLFNRNVALNIHMKIHEGIKEFQCPTCLKSFTQKSHLKSHLHVHAQVKVRQFECATCGKRFTLSSNLKKHLKIHTGVREFQCAVCGKPFLENSDLKNHLKIHTGTRDFPCGACGRKFIRRADLNLHMRTHSGVKEFQCPVCRKCFALKPNMKKHMRIHGLAKKAADDENT